LSENNEALTMYHTSSCTEQFLPCEYLDINTDNEMCK
jgi:hypothetical protein